MGQAVVDGTAHRMVRRAAIACAVLAVVALIVFAALGRAASGAALAIGLLLGTTNGLIAARFIRLPLPFVATSLLRLVTLSMVGIAIGLALGISNVWLVILGLGGAQLALAASAVSQMVRR